MRAFADKTTLAKSSKKAVASAVKDTVNNN
jgi:hypothetical protein